MKTFNFHELERSASQLALELTPRQRYLCSILIAKNPVVTDQLRSILMHALEIHQEPDPKDPVFQAVLALGNGKDLATTDPRARGAFTVLRSLGVIPDLHKSIRFVRELSGVMVKCATK